MVNFIKQYFYRRFRTSFSKSGEDIQLWQLLKKSKGTYIDVGGHHPIYSNNSYFFYLRGWSGIVVEPNPIFKDLYNQLRPKDIFISKGIANVDGFLEYFELEGNVRNTFSPTYLTDFNLEDKLLQSNLLPVKRLNTVFSEFLKENENIDFLSIDVEGMEIEVIKSNDWVKFRPKYILLETHIHLSLDITSELTIFLKKKEYSLVSKSLQGHHLGTLWFRADEVVFK